jgi:phage shock protein PspC (stress-responsive transcriptional regulator)/FtsH-binding integral membrane protein
MTETAETIATPAAEPRRLTRSRDGRWLGGVCAGLGRYFDLNPMIYRIGFAALSLAGGTGILLYVAAWLVMPDEGVEDSIAAETLKHHRDRPWLLVGVGLLAFAALVALSSVHVWPSPGNLWVAAALVGGAIVWSQTGARHARHPAPPPAPPAPPGAVLPPPPPLPRPRSLGPLSAGLLIGGLGIVALVDVATGANVDWRIVLACAAVILGGVVAAGAATNRSVGSVVVLGLMVLAVLAVAVIVRVPIFAGIGDRIAHPVAFTSVGTTYEQGIGNLNLELQDVRFPVGETDIKTTLGIGDLVVTVPKGVTVKVDAHAGAGQVTLFGKSDDGTSVHSHTTAVGTTPSHVLVLHARVGLGHLEVQRG